MRILYDHQIFTHQKFGGISRYYFELYKRFVNESYDSAQIAIKYTDNDYLHKSGLAITNTISMSERLIEPIESYNRFITKSNFKGKGRLFNLTRKLQNKPLLNLKNLNPSPYENNQDVSIDHIKNGKFDIFHPTYYDTYFLEFINKKPYVVTIHDLIHELFPELWGYERTRKHETFKLRFLKNASRIISISEQTKKDIVDIYNIPGEKIKVIHLANSLNEKYTRKTKIPEKFILYIGSRGYHKNFYFALRSIASYLNKKRNLYLLCCGGTEFSKSEINYFANLGLNDKILHLEPNDQELTYIYKKALVLLLPSIYEGFGIPLLEAASLGCPVVASDIPCFREIAEDSIEYFEKKNVESLRESITKVCEDKKLRKALTTKALERSKLFSWEKTYTETRNLYNQLV